MRGFLKASISLTIISARLCIFGLGFDSIRAKNLPRLKRQVLCKTGLYLRTLVSVHASKGLKKFHVLIERGFNVA